MIKYYCDSCKKEIKLNVVRVDVPCHLYSKSNDFGYIDADGNRTSGKLDNIVLCQSCANIAYSALVECVRSDFNNAEGK